MASRGKSARQKGLAYEREMARKLREFFPNCARHLEFQNEQAQGFDLDYTDEWKMQLKRLKNYAPINKIEEIKAEGKKILITKADHKPDILCMYLEDFFYLLRKIKFLEEETDRLVKELKRALAS